MYQFPCMRANKTRTCNTALADEYSGAAVLNVIGHGTVNLGHGEFSNMILDTLRFRLAFCQADRGDLGVGIDHARHHPVICFLRGAEHNIGQRNAGLILGHMCKRVWSADVSNGIYVLFRGAQAPVNTNPLLAKLDTGFFQPQPMDHGTPARCHQDAVTFNRTSIGQRNLPCLTFPPYTGNLGGCNDRYSLRFQGVLEQ